MGRFAKAALLAALIALAVWLFSSAAHAQGSAEKNYAAKCATCHGADGHAQVPAGKALKARDFHAPEVQSETDEDMNAIIAKGKNKMPAFEKQLKPNEIQDLVAYCRALGKK
ncbi:MAG TPA: c-type cytochrome [Candidatus Acidoferrales bacterium]|nr:c-type cytochrome [Candidatus Acidoferrales bacterium]